MARSKLLAKMLAVLGSAMPYIAPVSLEGVLASPVHAEEQRMIYHGNQEFIIDRMEGPFTVNGQPNYIYFVHKFNQAPEAILASQRTVGTHSRSGNGFSINSGRGYAEFNLISKRVSGNNSQDTFTDESTGRKYLLSSTSFQELPHPSRIDTTGSGFPIRQVYETPQQQVVVPVQSANTNVIVNTPMQVASVAQPAPVVVSQQAPTTIEDKIKEYTSRAMDAYHIDGNVAEGLKYLLAAANMGGRSFNSDLYSTIFEWEEEAKKKGVLSARLKEMMAKLPGMHPVQIYVRHEERRRVGILSSLRLTRDGKTVGTMNERGEIDIRGMPGKYNLEWEVKENGKTWRGIYPVIVRSAKLVTYQCFGNNTTNYLSCSQN